MMILVGRGPTARDYDWSANHAPVMAVSSGIFAVPETVIPEHFVTLDEPKFFLDSVTPNCHIAWQEDQHARHWPFWADHRIEKHTLPGRVRNGRCRHFPGDVVDIIPDHHKIGFCRSMAGKLHEFGYQPGWADYPSVRGWITDRRLPPNFTPDGPFGLSCVNSSVLFAVQIAHRIGHDDLVFVGIDVHGDDYGKIRETLRAWYPQAVAHDKHWSTMPGSALAEFMPSVQMEVAA